MITRIYIVLHGDERRLVEAGSAAQAIRHCVRNVYSAKAATPKDIAALMLDGRRVERASDDELPKRNANAEQQTHATN